MHIHEGESDARFFIYLLSSSWSRCRERERKRESFACSPVVVAYNTCWTLWSICRKKTRKPALFLTWRGWRRCRRARVVTPPPSRPGGVIVFKLVTEGKWPKSRARTLCRNFPDTTRNNTPLIKHHHHRTLVFEGAFVFCVCCRIKPRNAKKNQRADRTSRVSSRMWE